MKFFRIFVCSLVCLFIGCTEKGNQYYHGIVLDEDKKPLKDVVVTERGKYSQCTSTIETGYFRLYKNSYRTSGLSFSKEGFITDSIETEFYVKGKGDISLFRRQKPDTVILKKRP